MRRTAGLLALALAFGCADDGIEPVAEWRVAPLASPAGGGSAQAHFAQAPNGELILSWLEPVGEEHRLAFSLFSAGTWSEAETIAAGDNWFVNWADFPSVVPITNDLWIAHWLVLKPEQYYAYDIAYAITDDGGDTWSVARILNADDTIAEHGFVSFYRWEDDIGAVWLDGRIVGAMTIDELFAAEEAVGMSLRYARMTTSGNVIERGQIDELVCDCCQTGAATTAAGPLIVYRDRSQQEQRDIVARDHDGRAWSEPRLLGPDGWIIDGCPVNGPSIDASDEVVAVAWFTAPDDAPLVKFARSVDSGRSFSDPLVLDGAGAFGHTDVVLATKDTAYVSWWRRGDDAGMHLVVARITEGGNAIETRTIIASESRAPIDVPQMALVGNRLVFAWTEFGADPGIRSVSAPIW